MRDPITDAAQDPSCLLCLTPDRGGSWWSRLRPPTPRNFAAEPMTWREFSAVAAAVGTDGFSLEITFNRPSKTAGYLFYGAHFFGFMLAATNILCRISVDNYVFIEEAVVGDLSGRHTLKMTRRQGGVDYYLDGALVKTNATAWDVDLSLVFTAGRYLTTDLDGTVESIALMNDTTGETVWQAAYSELYAIYEPRNFAANPMTWTKFPTQAAEAGTSDYRLNMEVIVTDDDGPIFGDFYWESVFYVFRSGNSLRLAVQPGTGKYAYTTIENVAAGGHSIVFEKTGSSARGLFDGAEVFSLSGIIGNTQWETRPVPQSKSGSILSMILTSQQETVWQPAYSDLYTMLPPPPWPSPVPRNFAEEPEAWRDEKTTAPLIGEDDCEFFIRYRLDGYPEGSAISQIFYHNSQNGSVNIAFAGDGTGGNYSVIRLTDTDGVVIPLDRVRQLGEHTIRVRRVGLTVTVEFDGEVAATSTGMEKVAVYSTTAPVSDFDGVIFETYWKSLTTGRTVWRYPSDAERVRLITKTNIRTDRGYFEQADTTVNSYVNTALDLRGRVSSYTVFIDFYPAVFPESNNAECHQELAGQGGALIGFGFPPICSVGYYKTVDQTYRLQFAQQSGSLRRTVNVTLAAALSGRCRIVGVVDVQSSSTTLTLYLDGEQIGTSTYSGIPDGTAASIARCFSVAGVKEYGGWINYTGKVYSCLLFDRALSAAEIAALTPKQA